MRVDNFLLGNFFLNFLFSWLVYVDQIGAATPKPCFVKDHGHSIGGGNYWTSGYREVFSQVRQKYPNQVIVTEENAEPYMDKVSGNLVLVGYLQTDYLSIPMYQAVYSPYYVSIGRIFDPSDFTDKDLFCVKLLQMFSFGSQMGWLLHSLFEFIVGNDFVPGSLSKEI